MPGRLSSPRFRRRALKGWLLLAPSSARGRFVSIFYWNTATVVETPLHGTGGPLRAADPGQDGGRRAAPGDRDRGPVRRHRGQARPRRAGIRARRPEPAQRHDDRPLARRRHPGRSRIRSTTPAGSSTTPTRTRSGSRWPSSRRPAKTCGRWCSTCRCVRSAPDAKRHWLVDSWSPRGGGGAVRGRAAPTARRFGSTLAASRSRPRRASAPRGCSFPPA